MVKLLVRSVSVLVVLLAWTNHKKCLASCSTILALRRNIRDCFENSYAMHKMSLCTYCRSKMLLLLPVCLFFVLSLVVLSAAIAKSQYTLGAHGHGTI